MEKIYPCPCCGHSNDLETHAKSHDRVQKIVFDLLADLDLNKLTGLSYHQLAVKILGVIGFYETKKENNQISAGYASLSGSTRQLDVVPKNQAEGLPFWAQQ